MDARTRNTDVVLVRIGVLAADREPGRFAELVLLTPSPRYVEDGDYRGGFSRADTDSFCRTDPAIARVFAQTTFLPDNRAEVTAAAVVAFGEAP